jgi:hypothetical protein
MNDFDELYEVEFCDYDDDPLGLRFDPWNFYEAAAHDDRLTIENTFDEGMLHPQHGGAEYLAAWWAYNDEEED